jgi:hypothetical protein
VAIADKLPALAIAFHN